MNKPSRLLSPLECVQNAWGLKMRDFRQWCSPAGQSSIRDWKTRQLKGAIIVSNSDMVDDSEKLLQSVRQNDNAANAKDVDESGTSVYLPVMITAISAIEAPPEYEVVIGKPNWMNVVVANDPFDRVVQMRMTPVAYRCQVAFFAPDQHAASSISNQFANFWRDEARRSFDVHFNIGYAGEFVIKDSWNFKVMENTLMPDKIDIGISTVKGVTVDCVVVGLEPTVVGLGGFDDDITDTGEPDGSIPPSLKPVQGGRDPEDELNLFVVEADVIDKAADRHTRVNIDPETKIITQTELKDGKL